MNSLKLLLLIVPISLFFASCATESSQSIQPTAVRASYTAYAGVKKKVSLGNFQNQSPYMRGVFSDGVDRLGNQGKTILITHLQQSGRFAVMDRSNMNATAQEAAIENVEQNLKGAEFVISGDVTEFGRKEVGDQQLFGVLGSGKEQIAYAKVSLYVVKVASGEVLLSAQGAGEYKLSNREVLGFGGTASYDSTLNGKVLDLAIREAVDSLASSVDQGLL